MRRFAKPLYGLTPVPGVRIPPSPPVLYAAKSLHTPAPPTQSQFAAELSGTRFLVGKRVFTPGRSICRTELMCPACETELWDRS